MSQLHRPKLGSHFMPQYPETLISSQFPNPINLHLISNIPHVHPLLSICTYSGHSHMLLPSLKSSAVFPLLFAEITKSCTGSLYSPIPGPVYLTSSTNPSPLRLPKHLPLLRFLNALWCFLSLYMGDSYLFLFSSLILEALAQMSHLQESLL